LPKVSAECVETPILFRVESVEGLFGYQLVKLNGVLLFNHFHTPEESLEPFIQNHPNCFDRNSFPKRLKNDSKIDCFSFDSISIKVELKFLHRFTESSNVFLFHSIQWYNKCFIFSIHIIEQVIVTHIFII